MSDDLLKLSPAARAYVDRRYPESDVRIDGDHITIAHPHGFFSGSIEDVERYAAADDDDAEDRP